MNRKLFIVFTALGFIFTVGTVARLDHSKAHDRYRREITKSQCQDLMANNSQCIENVTWDLKEMLVSDNCNGSCIEKKICYKRCLNDSINDKTCDKVSET